MTKHKFQQRPSLQLFLKLFGPYLQWFYHCFDRIVINGCLFFFTREINVAWFFRHVCQKPKVTKKVLAEPTRDYQGWVCRYARNHALPLEWAQKGEREEDWVRPQLQSLIRQNRFGVYYILQSIEQGWTCRVVPPRYPTQDPNLQFVRKHRSRFTHYYFYIRDKVAGAMVLRVGSFLPFHMTAYLNGHHFIERELLRQNIAFVKDDICAAGPPPSFIKPSLTLATSKPRTTPSTNCATTCANCACMA